MKTPFYNNDKNRNATANELARAIMNAAVECAIDSAIWDFKSDPTLLGENLVQLNEEQKQAVFQAMDKFATTLWPKKHNDFIDYQ